jgi:hypothetical protein
MSLDDFSNVTVSGDGPALTQVGFGTLAIMAYHTHFPERMRTYTSATGAVADGFDTDEPAYLMLQRAFQQSPRPTSVKIGRLANAPVMSQRITPVAANLTTYAFTITAEDELPLAVSVTSDGTALVDEICDAIETALNAGSLTGITVVPVGGATATALDVNATAGLVFYFSDWDPSKLKIENRTPDPGIAADLTAIRAYDADWYGFTVANQSAAICEEAADWAEAELVLFACDTSDWTAIDGSNFTDIQSVLDAKSYIRTICGFDLDDQAGYMSVAMLAERFPFDPGAPPSAGGTFNAKTLAGVSIDSLTPTQMGVLKTKGYTIYTQTAGRGHTLGGKAAGGEFLDKTRFVDWFKIRLQEKIAAVELNNDRVPYNAAGISAIESACRAQLNEGLASGGISPVDADGNPPTLTMPTMAETSQQDRASRILGGGGVRIEFQYAGAIDKTNVGITVTV